MNVNSGPAQSLYSDAGVDTRAVADALAPLLTSVKQTFALRPGLGRPLLPIGYFANVIDIGHGTGLAISTDGVGTKILIAEAMGRYDTIGIDCVAMNVNDVICVGAEPIAMTDYLAVQAPDKHIFDAIGKGLLKGCEAAGISIPGGEVAQVAEMLRGTEEGNGLDLVGTCVGLVSQDKILVGQALCEGDVVVGLASSGIHSNGVSLARRVLLDLGSMRLDEYIPELGRKLGEELLEPTVIYVGFANAALRSAIPIKAFVHITSDGLLNLTRVAAPAGFEIDHLPEAPPIFQLIQRVGNVPDEEMFRVFNMGTGFCVIVAPDGVAAILALAAEHGHHSMILGHVRDDPSRAVRIGPRQLLGRAGEFRS